MGFGRAPVSGVLRQREADLAHRGADEKRFGLKRGLGLRYLQALGVGATVNQNSEWKPQFNDELPA